jgi:uncharacterized membrane protein
MAPYQILLVLHVLGAIIAFGPTFAFPILGMMAAREPEHANFAVRATARISTWIVIPVALSMFITGFGMVGIGGLDVVGETWLLVSIVLYFTSLAISIFVQAPTSRRMIALSSAPRPAGATGPPPELMALARRQRLLGFVLLAFVIVIVTLMTAKPTF